MIKLIKDLIYIYKRHKIRKMIYRSAKQAGFIPTKGGKND